MMHGPEKSDPAIVAGKPANKTANVLAEQSAGEQAVAEPVERRAGTKGNADRQSTYQTQGWTSVSQALERIRKVARERKKERFTALYHHINIELLEEAFYELQENAAPGVDRLTWKDYEANLERNLEELRSGPTRSVSGTAVPTGVYSQVGRRDRGRQKVSYILDADIRSFFDEIDQDWLIRFLEHRIGDRRIIRLIQKWL